MLYYMQRYLTDEHLNLKNQYRTYYRDKKNRGNCMNCEWSDTFCNYLVNVHIAPTCESTIRHSLLGKILFFFFLQINTEKYPKNIFTLSSTSLNVMFDIQP